MSDVREVIASAVARPRAIDWQDFDKPALRARIESARLAFLSAGGLIKRYESTETPPTLMPYFVPGFGAVKDSSLAGAVPQERPAMFESMQYMAKLAAKVRAKTGKKPPTPVA